MDSYERLVIDAIAQVMDIDDTAELHSGIQIERDLGFDSGLYIELIMYLEDAIDGLHLDPASLDIKHFETVGSIARYINGLMITEAS
ncbi:phosphopantetheine-binding protein [Pectobacteriaceae bacterium CE70]|uniref:phosphopantetheine-binding protein n=1 Tax=Brenneria uluponensis TaxID=3057057 RepID=UPI0025B612AA|nr:MULTISPECIES: phosphopantetheine-binding protein [Pectobacteriaceae]WJV59815.1 phosphopantetheine-binding protein [Pectobacteriaceae bacterium C111]WJV64163.1 phosphopantetheine-binding protein [Pectobacteriaceae bacterium C52]WJV65406.1 phosphopantetheine-binding protein [Pectobacteriaceae bacterium CE70]WJY09423.1 phosphopantetheine-binding protein [Pectobacteriaceae bacterium C80]WJY13490.1 phosphopantetheine-binding protein [Pectobacteriaceae bacterium CE90]